MLSVGTRHSAFVVVWLTNSAKHLNNDERAVARPYVPNLLYRRPQPPTAPYASLGFVSIAYD